MGKDESLKWMDFSFRLVAISSFVGSLMEGQCTDDTLSCIIANDDVERRVVDIREENNKFNDFFISINSIINRLKKLQTHAKY